MALPFLLLGAAAVAGGFGLKKGVDARKNYREAGETTDEARALVTNATNRLSAQREKTARRLERYGRLKFELLDDELRRFVAAFRQLKHVELRPISLGGEVPVEPPSSAELRELSFSTVDALKATLAGGAAGATAGFVSFGAVGALASASTGTAIAGLSGAAATNATLAWFGGGALSAGGLGMAGGAYVLGGIVAGPVLAVGGMVVDARARKALEDARADLAQARRLSAEMNAARALARAIDDRTKLLHVILMRLRPRLGELFAGLEGVVARQTDYRRLDRADRERVWVSAAAAKTVKSILDAPIFDGEGYVTDDSAAALDTARGLLTDA